MKLRKLKSKILLILVVLSINCFGQFNTLNYVSNSDEKEETHEEILEENDTVVKKKKRFKIFSRKKKRRKKSIKSELDSLKGVISEIKEQNNLINENINDSILYYLKLNSREKKKENLQLSKIELIKDKLNKFHLPLKKIEITSSFGMRVHPISGKRKMHYGTDFRANYENVYCVLDGVVKQIGYDSKSGHFIKINHSNSYETIYMHLSEIYYKKGEKIKAGYIIAKSGNSGSSTAPHLHFSVKKSGKYINPHNFLNNIIKVNNLIANIYD